MRVGSDTSLSETAGAPALSQLLAAGTMRSARKIEVFISVNCSSEKLVTAIKVACAPQ
jgi:hypothetical protein